MSRCMDCGSKGDCDEFCGDSHSEMRDSILELRSENERLKELLKGLNNLAQYMYEKIPCDSTFSGDCTPCSYSDFLNANNLEEILKPSEAMERK